MDTIKKSVNSFILNPDYAEYLAILKAARNGAVYGAKIRAPHALVMVFLFRSGSFREKLKTIFKSTRQHARNLATFAVLYKTSMLLLRRASPAQKEEIPHTFLAGLLGGYIVFGRGKSGQSSVNQQIVIYVFARVVLGLAKLAVQRKRAGGLGLSPGMKDRLNGNAWPVFAALSWGMVMWLFRWYPEVLQPSLKSSMKYIYVNADHWDGLRNFMIHNT